MTSVHAPSSCHRLLRPLSLLTSLLSLALFATACSRSKQETAAAPTPSAAAPAPPTAPAHAIIETDKGTIEIEFFADVAPKAVENFKLLSSRGYYDGLIFHRIVKGFMIQGGDPEGTGRGGQSAWGGHFDDEIVRDSQLYQKGAGYKRGIVAMANGGPNTNASQFFIMHQDHPLPPSYVIFGRVIKGIEVVDTIAELPTVRGMDGGLSKPVTPAVMKKITIKP